MINLMVANVQESGRWAFSNTLKTLAAQAEIAKLCGWSSVETMVVTNIKKFDMTGEIEKFTLLSVPMKDFCLTGSKMFGLKKFFDECDDIDDIVWCHDLDAWPCMPFKPPEMADVGIATYSNSKLNGGSVFWKLSARDIIERIVERLESGESKEEPTLNEMLKSDEFRDRVTVVDSTYNVGCSGFVKRFEKAAKPVRVVHMNPFNRIAWETHRLDRNRKGYVSVSAMLELILRKHFDLAEALNPDDKRNKDLYVD